MLTRLHGEIEKQVAELCKNCDGHEIVVTIFDREGNLLRTSEQRVQLLGYDEDITKVCVFTHCHPDDHWTLMMAISGVVSTKTPGTCDFRLQHKDLHWIPMRGFMAPLTENEEVVGFVAAYYDNRMKISLSDLLVKLSHETPIL